jgi:hypothetical protein
VGSRTGRARAAAPTNNAVCPSVSAARIGSENMSRTSPKASPDSNSLPRALSTRNPLARASAPAVRTMPVLPIPASPSTSSSPPTPDAASSSSAQTADSSRSRSNSPAGPIRPTANLALRSRRASRHTAYDVPEGRTLACHSSRAQVPPKPGATAGPAVQDALWNLQKLRRLTFSQMPRVRGEWQYQAHTEHT